MVELGRLLTAMVTPMDERGEVDWAKTRDLANRILDSGSDGLVVGATTGEGPTLSHEEKLRLWGETKAAVGDRGAIIANTGNYSTWDSINLSREAEEVGVDALLLTVPTTTSLPRRAYIDTSGPLPSPPICPASSTTSPVAPAPRCLSKRLSDAATSTTSWA